MIARCSQAASPATDLPLPPPALLAADAAGDRRLSSPAGLRPFFAALEQLERKPPAKPVRILQIGDSHTANDAFSGRMREALQARFGAAGRGWLPAGIPFKYFRPRLVSVAELGWRHLGPADVAPAEAIGIDATVAVSEQRGAQMTLVSSEPEGFNRLAIEFLAQPQGGTLSIRIDQRRPIQVSTAAPTTRAMRRDFPLGADAHEVELSTIDEAPVQLIGWATERHRAGVIYENHGTIGATVDLLGRMSPATLSSELSDSRPALMVIAFGTNEGFLETLDLQRYRARFRDQVRALRRKAPQAAILVLGPLDGNQLDKSCPPGEGEAANAIDPCAWREPRNLAAVRRVQKAVAAEQGWAFWDWSQAMGGPGSMHRLVVRDPPLAYPDHVHLNKFGYAATADVLFSDLISAYERWRKSHAGR